MIDTAKTEGAAGSFDPSKINGLLSAGRINSVVNLEKAIFSLEYLAQLQKGGLDFVFKGGSAIQVILQSRWGRLSVDADICTDASEEELLEIMKGIYKRFDRAAFSFKARNGPEGGPVPFYNYILDVPSIVETGDARNFLLDVMGARPKYATTQVALKTPFYDSSVSITTPTIGALLGDKLSTIGPNTAGRRLADSRNGVEYAKHFYDINSLQEFDFDFEDCRSAFHEAIEMQSKIRKKRLAVGECCEDMLFTCEVACLSQSMGERAIARLQGQQSSRARSEFRILRDGLTKFRPFLVQGLAYSWDGLRQHAALTALLAKMIQAKFSGERARSILKASAPTKMEDINAMASKIKGITEADRWFIELDEIINFPKILKAWHDYFYLEDME